jgi:hypothetical protein
MNTYRKQYLSFKVSVWLIFFFGALMAQNISEMEYSELSYVPYCRMVKQYKKYDKRIVKTEAIYRSGGEISSFYHPSCPDRDKAAWVDYSGDLKKTTPSNLMKEMKAALDPDGRIWVTAIIRFDGPKPVEISPNAPKELAEIMNGINSRYGHMNQFDTRVVLIKVLSIKPVTPNTPWPK